MTSTDNFVFSIKLIYTDVVYTYTLPANISVATFIYKASMYASQDIFKYNSDNCESIDEIRVTAPGNYETNNQPEEAPPMTPEGITMREKFGRRLDLMTFYISIA